MTKINNLIAALMLFSATEASAQTAYTNTELTSLYTTTPGSVTSIHDPSVVYHDGHYYIWGSHLGATQSTDLINWSPVWANDQTFRRLTAYGATTSTNCNHATAFNLQQVTKVKNYKGEVVDFPNFDAEAYCARYAADKNTWINGDMWAPDIIYNKEMKKWCMYLSLNGDHWSSIIILLTSNSATGPFTYQGPIVMGGFDGQTRGGVAAPKIGETDYTIATGETTLPARYIRSDNGSFWPNCIDPCVFYDEEGELWMSYGSWSGGIFMLKLDKSTGLRDYTYTYPSDYNAAGVNGVSDPYFGKKIAGGGYASGEGSYIQHIGDYYYLFMSYGGFAPDGGYEMRIFRSKNPDGPYVDGSNARATNGGYIMNYGPNARTNMGMKLLGSYNNWGNQNVGECAQGHNSACTDDQGRSFVVYHTKFNDGTAGHQVRVHQLFVNEKGWLVAAPFIYSGEETTDEDIARGCPWTQDEIAGTYHFLMHNYKLDHLNFEEMTPKEITLTPTGTIKGDYTGTWKMVNGTAYINLAIGGSTYYGVICEQQVNGATKSNLQRTSLKAIAFTAQNLSGVSIWGYKLQDKYALAYNFKNNSISVSNNQSVNSNLKLMFPTTENTTLTWTSSNPEVISETGKYNPTGLTATTPITLTARMECGNAYWEQSYTVKAQKETIPSGDYLNGLVAYYDFDSKPTYNNYKLPTATSYESSLYSKLGTGTAPTLESDYERDGKYIHLNFGPNANNSLFRINNPLNYEGNDTIQGFTISAWVKRNDANLWDALWGFFNSSSASVNTGARLFLTGNSYLGYNDGAEGFFDLNHPDTKTLTTIPVDEWALVTITVGPENGIRYFINGANKTINNINTSYDVTGYTTSTKIKSLPLNDIVSQICNLKYFFLGHGSFWGSADACFDNLMIYNRELSSEDVSALKTMSNRVADFTIGKNGRNDQTPLPIILDTDADASNQNGIYDLTGRRINRSAANNGIYIINGKKVLIQK